MKKLLASFIVLSIMSGCVNSNKPKDVPPPSSSLPKKIPDKVRIIYKDRVVRCNLPKQPSELAKPLPLESPKLLVDKLTIKLEEWVKYGNQVEKNCKR